MAPHLLAQGANISLLDRSTTDAGRVQAVVRWSNPAGEVDIDSAALLLGPGGQVRHDDDFVFYNAPVSTDGAVRLLGKRSDDVATEDRIAIDLEALDGQVDRVLIAASLDAPALTGFGAIADLSVEILDVAGQPQVRFEVENCGAETAMVLGEVYLRDERWKFRAVGQGWVSGLAGLATDYGIAVGDELSDTTELPPDREPAPIVVLETPKDADEPVDPDEAMDEVVSNLAEHTHPLGAPPSVDDEPAPASDAAPDLTPHVATATPRPGSGVRTGKRRTTSGTLPQLSLAGDPSWQSARLFSITGVGTADEKERRATSALLSTMMAVREFGRALAARFGGPAGSVETYLEVPFKLEDRTVVPDGVIRVSRAGRLWTALLEVKTGDAALRTDQIERYLDVARQQGFDAVVTLSNDITSSSDVHPVQVDGRKLRKVALLHISWSEILHEAQMQLAHRGLGDRVQAWILAELVRYLQHPASGAAGFDDMGAAWVPVRDAVAANTLRPADHKIAAVTSSWEKLIRHLSLTMTSTLGISVAPIQPRKLARDHAARAQAAAAELAGAGTLSAALRIPGAAGTVAVTADLRTAQIRTSIVVDAPQQGGAQRRINWVVRQLSDAPDTLAVEAVFARRDGTACELLRDVRADPGILLSDSAAEIRAFRLTASSTMGPKRTGVRKAFVPSVKDAVEAFYARVVQGFKPSPPRLPVDVAADAIVAVDSSDNT